MTKYYLADFFEKLKSDGYSSETIYNYERDMDTFLRFLDLKHCSISVSAVTREVIDQFVTYLSSDSRKTAKNVDTKIILKNRSINRTLASLRKYFLFLIETNVPVSVDLASIKLLKNEKVNSHVFNFKDIERLIESPSHFEKNKLVALRNCAMLETLFASGMRISELINLRRVQLDNTGRIFIEGKGKKQRFIYLTERAQKHIQAYLSERTDDMPYLFIPERGLNVKNKNKHISPNYLQAKIKWYRELLGINVPTSVHSLRHGFATYLAEQGANPAAIQILLGHESLETTTRYVHASDKYAEKSHQKYHPPTHSKIKKECPRDDLRHLYLPT